MNAPVGELDDKEPLNYAPKKLRRPEQDQNPDTAGPKADPTAPSNAPESSEPPWRQKKQRGAFADDIEAGELRPRLSLVPVRLPEPPSPRSAAPAFSTMRSLVGVIAVVAAAIVGYRWGSSPRLAPPPQQLATAADRTSFTPGSAVSTTNLRVSPPDLKTTPVPSAASSDMNKTAIDAAPAGVTSTAAAPQRDAAEIAFLLKNGAELMANADVAAARLMFQHAAEAGSAEAAFALAETYDPLAFKKSGRRDAVTLDVTLARRWYEKARGLGSTAAGERIVKLTQLGE